METILAVCPRIQDSELNRLFTSAWPRHRRAKFRSVLKHALVYVCAYEGKKLVGFAKVVGDGGVHGFLLDPTVAPNWQRRGVGRKLVEACARESQRRGVEWLHVDYERRLAKFYRACGFSPTRAGLRNLRAKATG